LPGKIKGPGRLGLFILAGFLARNADLATEFCAWLRWGTLFQGLATSLPNSVPTSRRSISNRPGTGGGDRKGV